MFGFSRFLLFLSEVFVCSCRRRLDSILNHLSPASPNEAASVAVASGGPSEDEIDFLRLRKVFLSGKTRKFFWRKTQLQNLYNGLRKHKAMLVEAVCKDFGKKSDHENRLTLELAIMEVSVVFWLCFLVCAYDSSLNPRFTSCLQTLRLGPVRKPSEAALLSFPAQARFAEIPKAWFCA